MVDGHAGQGARLLRRLRLRQPRDSSTTWSTPRAPSSSPPRRRRRVVAAALAALELLEPSRTGSSGCRRTPRRCARRCAAEGLAAGGSETQIVPVEVGDAERTMELCERLLERGVFAQGIRPPTVPEGSSRLRFTVMATPPRRASCSAPRSWSARAARELGHRRRPSRARSARSSRLSRRARRLRHRHRHRGRQDRGRRGDRPHAGGRAASGSRSSSQPSPASTMPRHGRADHALAAPRCRLAPQSDDEIAPYRYGPPASPHLAAALAGEEIDPRAAARGRARRGDGRRRARLRGRRRPARPARPRLPGPRPRRRPGAAAGDRGPARPRHDQPHAADDRGGPRRRPRGRRGRPHALAGASRADRGSRTARRSPRSAGSRSRPCRRSTSTRPTPGHAWAVRRRPLAAAASIALGRARSRRRLGRQGRAAGVDRSLDCLELSRSRLARIAVAPITAPSERDHRARRSSRGRARRRTAAGWRSAKLLVPTEPWKIAPVTATPRLPPTMRNIESTPGGDPGLLDRRPRSSRRWSSATSSARCRCRAA